MDKEKIESNYNTYIKILKKYGLYTEKFEQDAEFNEKLKLGKFYEADVDGTLIDTIFKIASYCRNVNSLLPDEKRINAESLTKVCFLFAISKAYSIFEDVVINSLYLFNKYGIKLSKEEFLAIDNAEYGYLDDINGIAKIIYMANELTKLEK